jgi:hypothetical protein
MRWLMTQSLLSSWLYQFSAYDDYVGKAHEDFVAALKREPRQPSEAAEKGFEFEKLVFDICDGSASVDHPWYEKANEIAAYVKGGQRQLAASKEITVDGMTILLYGKLDSLKAGTIYDIKFTSNYEAGKFYNSPQHPMYFELVPEAKKFTYLVSNGRNSWMEEYKRADTMSIMPIISNFFSYLRVYGFLPIYRDKWVTKY